MKKRGNYNSKSQTTIFIIIGIILISVIGLFFLLGENNILNLDRGKDINPDTFLQSCIEEKVYEGLELISRQGGYVASSLYKTFKFSDETEYTDISYLCYTQNYYTPCINQEPMLIQHLKDEIETYISDDVKECFDDLTQSLEKQKYVVDATYKGFDVGLGFKKVIVNINGKLILTNSGETSKKEGFGFEIASRFYDLAIVVQEIMSQEAEYCHFENLGFMLFYPEFEIDKFRTSDLITIYTVKHRESEEWFRFAVRSCVIPPGF